MTADLKPYPAMKDSGVPWLGEVPEHWEAKRLKYLLRERDVFDADNGPLTDLSAPRAEREARSHLFTGAIGCYKNPHSHRDVELTFKEAFEMLVVASHLLQLLHHAKR